MLGPRVSGGQFVGGAEFFVSEPATEAEAFKDLLKSWGICENSLDLFADLVVTVGG